MSHVYELMAYHGIEVTIDGSKVYGIVVSIDQAHRARIILNEDQKKRPNNVLIYLDGDEAKYYETESEYEDFDYGTTLDEVSKYPDPAIAKFLGRSLYRNELARVSKDYPFLQNVRFRRRDCCGFYALDLEFVFSDKKDRGQGWGTRRFEVQIDDEGCPLPGLLDIENGEETFSLWAGTAYWQMPSNADAYVTVDEEGNIINNH